MAIRFLTRSRLTSAKQTLESFFSRRAFTSLPLTKPPETVSAPTLSLLRLHPFVAVAAGLANISPQVGSVRGFATRQAPPSLDDPDPDLDNPPQDETIRPAGCDYEHWLVVVEDPDENTTRDDLIDNFIKLLAQVVGSEEEAKMKIYSVSTKYYFAFGALVSEELSVKIRELPGVRFTVPDCYQDVKNKTYGGEPFINGQAVPYDPKYHQEIARRNAREEERKRRNGPPRDPRAFERRREMDIYWSIVQSIVGNTFPGGPQNMGPYNPGYVLPNNIGGGMQPNNMSDMAPNNSPNPHYGNAQNRGRASYQYGPANQNSFAPNMMGGNPCQNSNLAGMPNNVPYSEPLQSGPDSNQNCCAPTLGDGNRYQSQKIPGRDPATSKLVIGR